MLSFPSKVRVGIIVALSVMPLLGWAVPSVRADQSILDSFNYTTGARNKDCQTLIVVYNYPSDTKATEKICSGMNAKLVKDTAETDPNSDYYIVSVTIVVLNGTNPPGCCGITPSSLPAIWVAKLGVSVSIPSNAAIISLTPQSGTLNSQTSVTLSYCAPGDVSGFCLGLNYYLPYQTIQASILQTLVSWDITVASIDHQTILGNTADFGFIMAVPEGYGPFVIGASSVVGVTYADSGDIFGTHYTETPFEPGGSMMTAGWDFTMSPSSSPFHLTPGSRGPLNLTLTNLSGHPGVVGVSDSMSGSGVTSSPTSATMSLPGEGTPILTITICACNVGGEGTWYLTIYGNGVQMIVTVIVAVTGGGGPHQT